MNPRRRPHQRGACRKASVGQLSAGLGAVPVEGVEGLLAALHVALKGLLLGVHAHVDLEAVGGEEGLAAALLVAHKGVLAAVGLLVRAQVPRRAVRPGAAFKHALVTFHLSATDQSDGGSERASGAPAAR